jgi:hypothetical protein
MATAGTHSSSPTSRHDGEVAAGCPACPHAWDTHDQIAARYCAATVASRQERGCVCAPTP